MDRSLFSLMSKSGGRQYEVIMKILFYEYLRDPGLFYLTAPLCMASIPKVTSWSNMAALPPANTLKFQPSGKKEWKIWSKESTTGDFQEDSSYRMLARAQAHGLMLIRIVFVLGADTQLKISSLLLQRKGETSIWEQLAVPNTACFRNVIWHIQIYKGTSPLNLI